MKKDNLLQQDKISKAAPELYKRLDYNYQSMCAMNMVLDDEKLARKILKDCMKKTIKVIRKLQE